MKRNILKSIKLTFTFCVVLGVSYVLVLFFFGMIVGPGHGKPEMVEDAQGNVVGAANVGQIFTKDYYFWGRPSANDYDGTASGGTNKAPTDSGYLALVEERIEAFLASNPGVSREEVPAELVTASGSGLDPDMSPEAAEVQVARVAAARGVSVEAVDSVLTAHVQGPLAGVFGPSKVNVLKLNVALDSTFGKVAVQSSEE